MTTNFSATQGNDAESDCVSCVINSVALFGSSFCNSSKGHVRSDNGKECTACEAGFSSKNTIGDHNCSRDDNNAGSMYVTVVIFVTFCIVAVLCGMLLAALLCCSTAKVNPIIQRQINLEAGCSGSTLPYSQMIGKHEFQKNQNVKGGVAAGLAEGGMIHAEHSTHDYGDGPKKFSLARIVIDNQQ